MPGPRSPASDGRQVILCRLPGCFHFLEATPAEAPRQAVAAADGKDVRIGGGANVARDFLSAGLVDRLHVAILLGRGIRLWDDLRGLEVGYTVKAETAESGIIHLIFNR